MIDDVPEMLTYRTRTTHGIFGAEDGVRERSDKCLALVDEEKIFAYQILHEINSTPPRTQAVQDSTKLCAARVNTK